MPEHLLHFTTAALWLVLSVLFWRTAGLASAAPATAAGRAGAGLLPSLLLPLALVLHGILLYQTMATPDGVNFGLANAVSLIVWLTLVIYWFAGLVYPAWQACRACSPPSRWLRSPSSSPPARSTSSAISPSRCSRCTSRSRCSPMRSISSPRCMRSS